MISCVNNDPNRHATEHGYYSYLDIIHNYKNMFVLGSCTIKGEV